MDQNVTEKTKLFAVFGIDPILTSASRLTGDNFNLPSFFISVFLRYVSKMEALPILDSTVVALKPILTT
jgi:hypothetical protein